MEPDKIPEVNPSSPNTATIASRKAPHKYSTAEDLVLLKEVAIEKPFGRSSFNKWKVIHQRCAIPVKDGQSLQRRFEILVEHFDQKNMKSIRGSGLEEEYNEKMRLLQDIKDLKADHMLKEPVDAILKKNKIEIELNQAKEIRDAAVGSLKRGETRKLEDKSVRRNIHKQSDFIALVMKSDENDFKIKEAKIELETRRLELQEREFKLRERNQELKEVTSTHQREMEKKKLDLEGQKLENDLKSKALEQEEKKVFLQMLQNKFKNTE